MRAFSPSDRLLRVSVAFAMATALISLAACRDDQLDGLPGQADATPVHTIETYQAQSVAVGLANPWALEFLPDGNALVTEKAGHIRIVSPEGTISEPLAGVPAVDARGHGGLLDICLAVEFASSRMVYFSYVRPDQDGRTGIAVARGRLSDDNTRLDGVHDIFRQTPGWESSTNYGSRLVWGHDGYLYITLGDRGAAEVRELAQDLSGHIGKVVRIYHDGRVPESNPFVDSAASAEIWTYGHRNPQGIDVHPVTGDIWLAEHGPVGGDELNVLGAGLNYGWPVISYGLETYQSVWGDSPTAMDGMEQPAYVWFDAIAPSAMTFYRGEMFASWQNNVFITSLNPGGLVRLVMDGNMVAGEERLFEELGRLRDLKVAPDGALWVIKDGAAGELIRIGQP